MLNGNYLLHFQKYRYKKKIGYSRDILRQSACLFINQSLLMAMLHSLIARRRFGLKTQWRRLHKTLISGFGLEDMSLDWRAVVQILIFIFSGTKKRISHEYSSLVIIVINLIFMFSLWCIDWVGSLYANRILCISVLGVASGPRVKLDSCKSALNPTTVLRRWSRYESYSLMLCGLFHDAICFKTCLVLLCFSGILALRLHRFGKRELILVLFVRLFDLRLFDFVCFLFLLVSGKGCGVIMALPGLSSYRFLLMYMRVKQEVIKCVPFFH